MINIVWRDTQSNYSRSLFFKGIVAMLPLSIAVLPWGILAGSFAIDAGLSPLESQALSAILFAGSVQLVVIGMMKSGVGLTTMLIATLFITSRHFLYSMTMRNKISPLPTRWRLVFGFLLTDEFFALFGPLKVKDFNCWFALGAGFSFYIIWNISTFIGIVIGNYIPDLNNMGLDFAVAATFIAITVPNIKSVPVALSVITAFLCSVSMTALNIEGGLMIASISAMIVGYTTEQLQRYFA